MGYSVGSSCFASVGEAVAVAMAESLPAVDQVALRLIGWDSSTVRASVYRINSDGSGSMLQVSLPMCGPVNKALPLSINGKSLELPIKSYGADAGVYALTAYPGADYAQMPADVSAVGAFCGLGFATVVGLYWFSYSIGQVIDLIKHAR